MNATRINNRKTSLKAAVQNQLRRPHRLGTGLKKSRLVAASAHQPAHQPIHLPLPQPAPRTMSQPVPQAETQVVPQAAPQAKVQPPRRIDAADPQRALARVRTVRGQRVLLERDLASALGTLPGRLADLAMRHADWFPEAARFSLHAEEAVQQGLWYTHHQEQRVAAGAGQQRAGGRRGEAQPLVDWTALPPLPPVVYTADGLIAAAHWLSAEASRAGDPYAECADLSARFRLTWAALQPEHA